jgi:hypothetical protein
MLVDFNNLFVVDAAGYGEPVTELDASTAVLVEVSSVGPTSLAR